ncbi:MAG: YicC/YloC family endoribonuclease [Acidibrevibacterium sp.]|uniref:YicC/YloC family endoribonuclease n=1 Tax=Acidibrevibacterium sp. TaxID=2606776 RepID=UPI003CFE3BB3
MTSTLASMTGFAQSEGERDGFGFLWELRSVNGRGLDLRFRLPPGFDALEPGLREAAAKVLRRGAITASLTIRRARGARPEPDPEALEHVLALALALAHRIPGGSPPRAEALLALPGVLRWASEREPPDEAETQLVTAGFATALTGLTAMRGAEGARLASLLGAILAEIAALHAEAAALADTQPDALRTRLAEQLDTLLRGRDIPLPAERLAQEVALLATRADIREELDRIASHLAAAHALLAETGAVGRRFDFLVQEFQREANTLCSKAATTALSACGLRLKAAIEQLREQVQNVE